MGHPVIDLIRHRALSGSAPGARADAARLGLCVEGGAMRGVVSAGMVAGIEQLGLLRVFDVVIGCSAGAANAAYLVGGRATAGATIYYTKINNRSFIDAARPLRRRPVVDLGFLVDDVMRRQEPLDTGAILCSPVPLVIVASNIDSGQSEALTDFVDGDDVLGALRASAAMPILAGAPWPHRDGRYWDGSLTEPVPLPTAARLGCTHVLALLTRPAGVGRPDLSLFQRHVILPRVRRVSTALGDRFERQREEYSRAMTQLDADCGSVRVLPLRPSGPAVRNLERRRAVLEDGARQGISAVFSAFVGICDASLAPTEQRG